MAENRIKSGEKNKGKEIQMDFLWSIKSDEFKVRNGLRW